MATMFRVANSLTKRMNNHVLEIRRVFLSTLRSPRDGSDLGTFGLARSHTGALLMGEQTYNFQEFALDDIAPAPVGSMQLMAVPKKNVTPRKKGRRNGPKALKPHPVIIRCKCCGRVKLPHFFCCTGDRMNVGRDTSSS